MNAFVLACSSHFLIDLPIFFGPVAVIGGWMLMTFHKDRRRSAVRARDAAASRSRSAVASS